MINRGIAKRPLFEDRSDARYFLARLARQVRAGRVEVHAFCLMTTHFHLLVRSPRGELSEAMRRVQNDHSRRFNRRYRRDGALIRGRYFSRPVPTLDYRRALVRYIDANPVRAGIVRWSGEYELGSAAAFARGSGRPWLSRDWIESELSAVAGEPLRAYPIVFGPGDEQAMGEFADFLEARQRSLAREDELASLVGAAPPRVLEWMRRKAALADGGRIGLPVSGPLALRRALDDELARSGPWMVEDGRATWRGAELAWIGLLHGLCRLSWRDSARVAGESLARVRRLAATHARLLGEDPRYAERAAGVARAAIDRSVGRAAPPCQPATLRSATRYRA